MGTLSKVTLFFQKIYKVFKNKVQRCSTHLTVKKVQLGKEICISLKIDSVETKCSVRWWFTIMCHISAKLFLDLNLNQVVIDKISIFTSEIAGNSHIFFSSDRLLLRQWHVRYVLFSFFFFIFASFLSCYRINITSIGGPPCWCGGMIMWSVYKVPVWILSEPLQTLNSFLFFREVKKIHVRKWLNWRSFHRPSEVMSRRVMSPERVDHLNVWLLPVLLILFPSSPPSCPLLDMLLNLSISCDYKDLLFPLPSMQYWPSSTCSTRAPTDIPLILRVGASLRGSSRTLTRKCAQCKL